VAKAGSGHHGERHGPDRAGGSSMDAAACRDKIQRRKAGEYEADATVAIMIAPKAKATVLNERMRDCISGAFAAKMRKT
jgi:hypothetical protein